MAGDKHAARMAGRQVRAVMPQERFQGFGLFGRNVAGTPGARPLQKKRDAGTGLCVLQVRPS